MNLSKLNTCLYFKIKKLRFIVVLFSWQEPFLGESPDALGILGGGAKPIDGGEDALVVFQAYVLALANGGYMIATDGRYRKDLVAGDVKAAAFGAQTAAELLVTGAKVHDP